MNPRPRTAHGGGRDLVVGVDAGAMRRRVGPVAWCVLESVVAAIDHDGLATLSIRSVAAELGVSKNTVQRAMATLRTAALVDPIAARRDDGRFAAGAYRVSLARSVLAPVDTALAPNGPRFRSAAAPAAYGVDGPRSSRAVRRRVRSVVVEQLSLLPEV